MEQKTDILPKICIIYAHPSITEGKCPRILERVQKVYAQSGAQLSSIDLYREGFNPVMGEAEWKKYEGKSVPADVSKYQKLILESEVLVFIYPVWWSTPPAMLKGFIDRVFTLGFAYAYEGEGMKPLLNGKRALAIRTFASGAEVEQKNGQVASNFFERAVLGTCGIAATSVDLFSMETVAPTTFEHHLFQVEGAARRMLTRPVGVPHHLRWIPAPHLPPVVGSPKRQEKEEDSPKPVLDDAAKEEMEWAAKELRQRKSNWRAGEGKESIGQPVKKYEAFQKQKKGKQPVFTGDSTRAQKWNKEHNENFAQGNRMHQGSRPPQYGGQSRPQQGEEARQNYSRPQQGKNKRQQSQMQGKNNYGQSQSVGWQGGQKFGKHAKGGKPPQGNHGGQKGTPGEFGGERRERQKKVYSGNSFKRTRSYFGRQR